MVSYYTKEIFEKYAILILIEIYDSRLCAMYNDQKKYESPDWQSIILQIGIEVTQALDELEGEERAIINKVFGNGYSPQEAIEMVNKLSNGKMNDKVKDYNGVLAYSYHNGLFDHSFYINKIVKRLEIKHKKLNSKFKIFNENWLYIFTGTATINTEDFEPILTSYKKLCDQTKFKFQKIFLDCIINIYLIDEKYRVSIFEVDYDKRLEFRKILK